MIKDITAVVIDDEAEPCKRMHSLVMNYARQNSLPIDVQTYPSYEAWRDEYEQTRTAPGIFFLDNVLGLSGVIGLVASERIRLDFPEVPRVLFTQQQNFTDRLKAMSSGLIDADMQKPVREADFKEIFERFMSEGKFRQGLRVAIDGLGRYGKGIMSKLKERDFVEEIHVHSTFTEEDYSAIKAVMGAVGAEKIHYHSSLESLVGADTDVFIMTTGEHGIDFEQYTDRNQLWERLYAGSYKRVNAAFALLAERKYSGAIFLGSNPVWAYLTRATQHPYNLDPGQLTASPPGSLRTKWNVAQRVEKYFRDRGIPSERVSYRDVKILVVGSHGMELPILRRCMVRGEPLFAICPELNDEKTIEEITQEVQREGLRTMKASQKLEDSYEDAPDATVMMLEEISHYSRLPAYPGHCHIPEGVFMGFPTELSYAPSGQHRLKVNLRRDWFDEVQGDGRVCLALLNQIDIQKKFMKQNLR